MKSLLVLASIYGNLINNVIQLMNLNDSQATALYFAGLILIILHLINVCKMLLDNFIKPLFIKIRKSHIYHQLFYKIFNSYSNLEKC